MIPMMISCKKAADLTCASLDRPLSIMEKLQWRFHLLMCTGCKGFQKQNEALLRLFEQRFRYPNSATRKVELPKLPPDACERLKRRLREASHDPTSSE
jgi:hypothetical protein